MINAGVGITKTTLLRTIALADDKKDIKSSIELNSVLLKSPTDNSTFIELPTFDLLPMYKTSLCTFPYSYLQISF